MKWIASPRARAKPALRAAPAPALARRTRFTGPPRLSTTTAVPSDEPSSPTNTTNNKQLCDSMVRSVSPNKTTRKKTKNTDEKNKEKQDNPNQPNAAAP